MSTHRVDGGAATDPALQSLFAEFHRRVTANGERVTLRAWLDRAEAWRILDALREVGGNRSAAARSLGIGRRTLYTKMEKLGIHPSWEAGTADSSALRVAGPA
jgi:DNA-binding NtrC family response regulator